MENLQTKTGMVEWNHELTWGVFFKFTMLHGIIEFGTIKYR